MKKKVRKNKKLYSKEYLELCMHILTPLIETGQLNIAYLKGKVACGDDATMVCLNGKTLQIDSLIRDF